MQLFWLVFWHFLNCAISEDLHDVFTLREDTDCDTYDMIRYCCFFCGCCRTSLCDTIYLKTSAIGRAAADAAGELMICTRFTSCLRNHCLQNSLYIEQRGKPAEDELSSWGQVHCMILIFYTFVIFMFIFIFYSCCYWYHHSHSHSSMCSIWASLVYMIQSLLQLEMASCHSCSHARYAIVIELRV